MDVAVRMSTKESENAGRIPPYYCLVCRKVRGDIPSAVRFRTGYYRNAHPLGICLNCQARRSSESKQQDKTRHPGTTAL
jgi:hypothetical protein